MSHALWDHQVHAIKVAEVTPDLGLFFEQGTGKTRTAIEILRRRYAKVNRLRKTLILAPIIVCENWKKEFKAFSKIAQKDILVLTGSGKKRVAQFTAAVGDDLSGNKIIITNYESMQMEDFYKLLCAWQPEIFLCDESQRLKNPQSVRAKAAMAIADASHHNYALTGTPVLQSAMDLFMQFRILDRGMTFGKNFFGFRHTYFEDVNAAFKGKQSYFPKWEARESAYDQLQNKIKAKAIRVLKKDCLDLPPFVRQQISVALTKDQARAYKEMYNDYITFIESKSGEPRAVVAQMAVTKALRLQQIVSGFAKDEEGNIIRFSNVPRLDALKDLLESLVVEGRHKVIVWAVFKENYKQIAEVCIPLGITYTEIHGDIKQSDREHNMEEFRKNPDVGVMIANQGAGGVGVNLIEASYSIYYSKGFKLEDDLQSEARNYRGGSEMHTKVTRIDLVTPGSIDELVNEALYNKQAIGDKILGWQEQMNCTASIK